MIQQTSFLENNLHCMNMPSSACSRNFRTIPDRQKMHEGIQNWGRWCVQEGGSNNSWVSPPQTRISNGPKKRKKQLCFILRSGTIRYRKWTLTKSKCINFLGWWIAALGWWGVACRWGPSRNLSQASFLSQVNCSIPKCYFVLGGPEYLSSLQGLQEMSHVIFRRA